MQKVETIPMPKEKLEVMNEYKEKSQELHEVIKVDIWARKIKKN